MEAICKVRMLADLLIWHTINGELFELTFLVTEIGCGIAGFIPEEIAPLFKDVVEVENIHLPKRFWEVFNQ